MRQSKHYICWIDVHEVSGEEVVLTQSLCGINCHVIIFWDESQLNALAIMCALNVLTPMDNIRCIQHELFPDKSFKNHKLIFILLY